MLYARLLVTMVVTLYTSRVILNALGEVDFGVYSVVAGVVIMIAFMNNSLTTATQRFLNYEMARQDMGSLSEVFSTAVISHYVIAGIVAVAAETVGLWLVKTQLDIPPARLDAAIMVFHCSVVTLVFRIIGSPYNAAVIANERMKVYALISILEAVLTLLLVLILVMLPWDKLAVYGVLTMVVGIITRFAYIRYCHAKFPDYRFRWIFDRDLFRRMFSFTGWMLAGTFAGMLNSQGLNVLINIYFGPVLNAARTIAVKVQGVVQSFVDSLITAVQPQIVKSYSAGETAYMNRLVFTSSKLSFYIVLLLSLPVLLNAEAFLSVWLRDVPEYAALFTRLLLIDMLITCSYTPLAAVSQASGRVKMYQIIISASFVLVFLLTWLCYYLGGPVWYVFVISIAVNFIALFARLLEIRKSTGFDAGNYMRHVFIPETAVLCISVGAACLVTQLVGSDGGLAVISAVIYLCTAAAAVWFIGLNKTEKELSKGALLGMVNKNLT